MSDPKPASTEPAAEPASVSDVIASLPPEVYERDRARGLRDVARDGALYVAAVGALIFADAWWLLIPLWALASLATTGLFVLAHDAAHGSLFDDEKLNWRIGQLCMLPSLHVFEAWRLGHNRIHHAHTSRATMDYVWHPVSPAEYRALSPLQRLAHRIKWSWAGAGIYYGWDIWWKSMMLFEPPKKIAAELKRDRAIVWTHLAVLSLALLVAGAVMYGSLGGAVWMWIKVFFVPFVIWNYAIGSIVHQHHIAPDMPWQDKRGWDRFEAQMAGTTVLRIPRWLNYFFRNIMIHVPHHVDMRIPWYHLPQAYDVIRERFEGVVRERDLRLRDYIHITRRCKLFDFDAGRWLTYREALQAT